MAYKVLYIEDNPDNKLLIQRALEAKGYEFIWAATGKKGVELAFTELPDVILLDINLPDIDGYEVARHMRTSGTNMLKNVSIIAITANALKGDAEKALAAGCNVYMSKPINIRELWARVEACIEASLI